MPLVSKSARIAAPAERVYKIIADYHNGHPRILPKEFSNLKVLKGGIGAGTAIEFEMHAFGRTQTVTGIVTEPDPGRVLVESYPDGTVTTFTVDSKGPSCDVTISTELAPKSGLHGILERAFAPRLLRSIYERELALLEKCAQSGV